MNELPQTFPTGITYITDILKAFIFRIHKSLVVLEKMFFPSSEYVAYTVTSASDLQEWRNNSKPIEH